MRETSPDTFAQHLLGWYDQNARVLPWRIGPHDPERPDPYRVWLSEIMLQQTTVAAVKSYFERFTTLWPSVIDLANAADEAVLGEWAGLGYYARARNLLKCARLIRDEYDGTFPNTRDALIKLPGIGPYTAAAIASIAFKEAATVVDGNVERVMARVFQIDAPLPAAKPLLTEKAAALTPAERPGDYAQAVMDLGATICTPKSPKCALCPVEALCQISDPEGAAGYPKKTPKKPKPTRYGYAYVARTTQDAWVLIKREEKGLLGGMLCWPTSDWGETLTPNPPFNAHWQEIATIRHTFTHFHLELTVQFTNNIKNPSKPFILIDNDNINPSSLPSVMRKVFDATLASIDTVSIP